MSAGRNARRRTKELIRSEVTTSYDDKKTGVVGRVVGALRASEVNERAAIIRPPRTLKPFGNEN